MTLISRVTTVLFCATLSTIGHASEFLNFCLDRDADYKIRKTISVILEKADTSDCSEATAWLQSQTTLNLADAGIEDVRPLAGLLNLEELDLIENYITDVTPLGTLLNLTTLDLTLNWVEDIGPLETLVKMECLYLAKNRIRDASPLHLMDRLHIMTLHDNFILPDAEHCPFDTKNHLLNRFCRDLRGTQTR